MAADYEGDESAGGGIRVRCDHGDAGLQGGGGDLHRFVRQTQQD